jgi:hypothetical protein
MMVSSAGSSPFARQPATAHNATGWSRLARRLLLSRICSVNGEAALLKLGSEFAYHFLLHVRVLGSILNAYAHVQCIVAL